MFEILQQPLDFATTIAFGVGFLLGCFTTEWIANHLLFPGKRRERKREERERETENEHSNSLRLLNLESTNYGIRVKVENPTPSDFDSIYFNIALYRDNGERVQEMTEFSIANSPAHSIVETMLAVFPSEISDMENTSTFRIEVLSLHGVKL